MRKKYIILGDVHGDLDFCRKVCLNNLDSIVIQIGDLGVGFVSSEEIGKLPRNFNFFCGNHDNRNESYNLKNCLGDFGEINNMFFVSGADSIDKQYRTENVDWWPNEELSKAQADEVIERWTASRAQILLAHDAPQSLVESYYLIYDRSFTRRLLQELIEIRKPELFIYGHHHRSFRKTVNGIKYIGLNINEIEIVEI